MRLEVNRKEGFMVFDGEIVEITESETSYTTFRPTRFKCYLDNADKIVLAVMLNDLFKELTKQNLYDLTEEEWREVRKFWER